MPQRIPLSVIHCRISVISSSENAKRRRIDIRSRSEKISEAVQRVPGKASKERKVSMVGLVLLGRRSATLIGIGGRSTSGKSNTVRMKGPYFSIFGDITRTSRGFSVG